MHIETGYLILAMIIGIGVGALLHWWQRPVLSPRYLVVTVIGTTFAVYYILHVVFGSGRTGWP